MTNAEIITAWSSLIGFRNDTTSDELGVGLTTSETGLYYNDYHKLIKMTTLDAVRPLTQSLVSFLTTARNGAVMKVISRFINEKKISGANKSLFEDQRIFDGAGKMGATEVKQGRLCGLEFTLDKYEHLKAQIVNLGVQFSAVQTDLPIYLYHSSQVEPIKTTTISTTEANSFAWKELTDWVMHHVSTYDSGGKFYLCYYEDDLNGQAINKEYDWVNGACGDCPSARYNSFAWKLITKYMVVRPFSVDTPYLNGTDLFDISGVSYATNKNFGLNVRVTVGCDVSNFFVQNKSMFTDVLGKQVAVDLISEIVHSTRTDEISDKTRDMALSELKGYGDGTSTSGLEHELNKAYKALSVDTSALGTPCMGKARTGIKYGAI